MKADGFKCIADETDECCRSVSLSPVSRIGDKDTDTGPVVEVVEVVKINGPHCPFLRKHLDHKPELARFVDALAGSGNVFFQDIPGIGDERIALPGGGGVFQALNTAGFQGANGWRGTGGSSFVYWVELTPKGPVGKQIQVQGQSSDSTSALHVSQTRLYSDRQYLDILYTEQQIKADPNLTTKVLRSNPGGRP